MLVIELSVPYKRTILFLLLLIFCGKSFAQVYPDESVHQFLKSGINLIIDQNYNQAENIFKQLDKARPDLPLGKIYLAAVCIARSYDYDEKFDDELISGYLESAKKISEKLLDKDPKNIWNNYFLALSEGYNAYYDALRGNWLSAFSTGINSVKYFENCLELDKNFYESLIAIGSYKFWQSKKTEFLSWLPFFDDETEIGVKYLKAAVKNSGYNSHLAIHSLIWIYIEQQEFQKAKELSELALKDHPDSRIFKWGLARAYEDIDPITSAKLYQDILLSYPFNSQSNRINTVVLKHLAAQQFNKAKKTQEALKLCDEILSINNFTEYELSKISSRLERVKNLKKELVQQ